MNFFGRIGKVIRTSLSASIALAAPGIVNIFRPWLFGADTTEPVTPKTSQTISAFYQAVGIKARTNAALPLVIYRKSKDGGREEAVNHPLYNLLKWKPWSEGNSFEWREMLVGHLEVRGNCYAFKLLNGDGSIQELIPLHPDRVRAARDVETNALYYQVLGWKGEWFDVPRDWMLHVKNRSDDGVYGLSVIELARRDLDRAMMIQKYGNSIYKNGARLAGVLEHPTKLSPDGAARLRESFKALYGGPENAGSTAVLEEGMKYNTISMTAESSQFLLAGTATVEDIARWTNVSKHMLGIHSDASFSNMEQQALEFVQYTVFPECSRWEAAFNEQLLTESERRKGYFIEYKINGLLRGDTATRFASYAIGRQWGFYSSNDIRSLENFNPVKNGDIYLQPVNMVEAGTPYQPVTTGAQGDAPGGAPVNSQPGKRAARTLIDFDARHMGENLLEKQKRSFQRIFEDRVGKILVKESKFLEGIAKRCAKDRDLGDLTKQVEKFYSEHRAFVGSEMRPLAFAFGEVVSDLTTATEAVLDKKLGAWADDYCARQQETVLKSISAIEPIKLLEHLNGLTQGWRENQFAGTSESLVTTILTTTEIAA